MNKLRVLVVDDFPDAADVTCVLLKILGYEAAAAPCGRDALDKSSTFDPDIVMLDLGLPDMSGIEVGRKLRQRCKKRVHLAAITGSPCLHLRGETRDAGFDQHVIKPTDRAKLEAIVSRACTAS